MADRTVKVDLQANVRQYETSVDRAANSTDALRTKAERFNGKEYRAKLAVDVKDAEKNLQRLQKRMELDNPQLDIDIRQVEIKSAKVQADLDKLRTLEVTPEVQLKIDAGEAELDRLTLRLNELNGRKVTPEVEAETREAEEKLQALRNQLQMVDLLSATVEANADTTQAMDRLALLRGEIARVDLSRAEPEAELKATKLFAEVAKVEADLARLGAMEASPEVDLEIAQASAKLAVLQAELAKFDGRTFRAKAEVDTSAAVGGVGALVSALVAIGPAAATGIAVGAGAVGGLTTMLTGATAAAATGMLAFKGIGDAVSAMNAYALEPSEANLKKMQESMRGLTPVAQAFARQVADLRPQLDGLRATAQNGLLPGAAAGLREVTGLLPNINAMVGRTATAMGDLAKRGGEALNSPFWRQYIDFMGNEASTTLVKFIEVIGNLIKGFAGMQMAFKPVSDMMINGLGNMATSFANWATTLDQNQGFQEFIDYVTTNGPVLMDTIGSIVQLLGTVIEAMAPIGPVALQAIGGLADALNAVLSVPGLGTGLVAIASGLAAINLALRAVQAVRLSNLAQALGGFSTAGRASQAAAAGAAQGITAVGAAGAGAAGGVTRAGTAATGSTGAMTKLASAGGALLRNLPLIGAAAIAGGIAIDAMTTSYEEANGVMMAGGPARGQMLTDLANEQRHLNEVNATYGPVIGAMEKWHNENIRGTIGLDEYNRRLGEQRAAMGEHAWAQQEVTAAQNNLNQVIAQFGPGSAQAALAAQELAAAEGNVALQGQLANKVGLEYYQTLAQMAQQAGPAGDAARKLAAGLDTTELAAMGAKVQIDAAGRAVAIMPDGKRINVEADTANATFQLGAVNSQLLNIPAGKTVNVGVIGAPAQESLRQIGFEVKQLPNGTVEVSAKTEGARAQLDVLVRFGNALQANPQIGANPTLAYDELLRFINEARAAKGEPAIAPRTEEANVAVGAMVNTWNGMQGTPKVNADTTPAIVAAEGWRLHTEGLIPTPNVNANTIPAHNAAFQWNNDTQSLQPVPNVNANTGPAWGESFQWNMNTGRLEPVPRVNADTAQADQKSGAWNQRTDALNPTAEVNADTSRADAAAGGFWNSWAGRTITWFVNLVTPNASGAIYQPMASGGIVNPPKVEAFAEGDAAASPYGRTYKGKKLRNMPNTGARMVAPGSWRVVGDRLDVPELYAPLDGSARSLALISQGANTFGKTLVDTSAIFGDAAKRSVRSTFETPRPVNVPQVMASVGAGEGRTTNNYVTVNNPIAERSSDSVQRELSKMADLGLFGDD